MPLNDFSNFREAGDKLVVVLLSGRPLNVKSWLEDWYALVAVWLPCMEGGGVADVLFREVPFSDKLPFTWPQSTDQLSFEFEELGTDESAPLFPFGYSLEIYK